MRGRSASFGAAGSNVPPDGGEGSPRHSPWGVRLAGKAKEEIVDEVKRKGVAVRFWGRRCVPKSPDF